MPTSGFICFIGPEFSKYLLLVVVVAALLKSYMKVHITKKLDLFARFFL